MSPKSLKEQLEESFELAESEEEEIEESEEPEEEEEQKDAEPEIDDEVDSGDDEQEGPGDSEINEPVSDASEESRDEEVSEEEERPSGLKAPVSWKPTTREHWDKVPVEVQEEILKREGDIQKGLQQASQHKKVAEEYFNTVSPFQQMIQASGASPSQAINQMFTTAHGLTYGSPKQKAEIVRDIISNYGVDIETLDQTLAGMEVNDVGDPNLLKAMDEKLAPITNFMNQMQGYQQTQDQQVQDTVTAELEAFATDPKNEFYEDVREDMADLLELAHKRGRNLSLQQAYDEACQFNPEIKKVVDHRAAKAKAARPDPKEMERKRKAAASISGDGPTGGDRKEATDLRGAIANAMDELASS